MTPTPKTTIENLFGALDLAVFVQLPGGMYQPVGATPSWLELSSAPIDLTDRFPILEIFLPESETVWETGGTAQSDIWTEPDPAGGDELYLQAVAALAGDRRYIALRRL